MWVEVRPCAALEPGPLESDGIEIGRVGRQQGHLYRTVRAVEVGAHDPALVLGGAAVPDDQQLVLELCAQGFEELHNLRGLDRAVDQPKQEVRACQASDHRDVLPVEEELDDRRLSLRSPGAHPRRPLAQARLVDEDDQPPLGRTLFIPRRTLAQWFCITMFMEGSLNDEA